MKKVLLKFSPSNWKGLPPIVWTLIFGSAITNISLSMSIPFLAILLSKKTNLSALEIGIIIGAAPFVWTFSGFLTGAISDRLGRRGSILFSMFIWAITFALFSFATDPIEFFLLNCLNGLCKSFYDPSWQALFSEVISERKKTEAFNLRYLFSNLGHSLGPIIGAYFASKNISLGFLITSIAYLIFFLVLFFIVPQGVKKIRVKRKSFLASFRVLAKDHSLKIHVVAGAIVTFVYSQIQSTMAQFIPKAFENGVELYSFLLSARGVSMIFFQLTSVRKIEKQGPLWGLVKGSLLYALAFLLFVKPIDSLIYFIFPGIIIGMGEALIVPSGLRLIDKLAIGPDRGLYFGAAQLKYSGFFLGPIIGGYLLQYLGSYLFVIISLCSLASAYIYKKGFSGNQLIIKGDN